MTFLNLLYVNLKARANISLPHSQYLHKGRTWMTAFLGCTGLCQPKAYMKWQVLLRAAAVLRSVQCTQIPFHCYMPHQQTFQLWDFLVPVNIICYNIKWKRASSQLLQVLSGTAGTQPPICFTKRQSSNWGRGGGSKNLNKNLNKLLKKLPEQAEEEKTYFAVLGWRRQNDFCQLQH